MPGPCRAPRCPAVTFLMVFVLGLAFVAPLAATQVARAQTIYTVSSSANDGPGSLRQTILAADPGDTIDFDESLTTINLTAEIVIDKNLTITGPGADVLAISGDGSDRVFTISTGVTVSMSGLTISGGGGVNLGAGVRNRGTLTISDSTISGNSASGGENIGTGGGVHNTGNLTISGSIISDNTVSGDPGHGGGIYSANRTLTISDSTISGNSVSGDTGWGGGIHAIGTLTITSSTISGNTVSNTLYGSYGGGIYASGTSSITDSTISGNTVHSTLSNIIHGGGIYADGTLITSSTITSSTITSSTITNNTASSGSSMIVRNGSATVQHSIVDGHCRTLGPGSMTSLGHNLTTDQDCTLTESTDQQVTDLGLAALADNGGPTQTHAITESSPAYNAGGAAPCPTARDQRGIPRPHFGACDIGAFEIGAFTVDQPTLTLPADMTVDATGPDGAVVDFAGLVSATDWLGNDVAVTCTPASGTSFTLGTHEVECWATDYLGQTTPTDTFTVTVLGGDVLLAQLVQDVHGSSTPAYLKPRLLTYLNVADRALDRENTPAACVSLQTFSAQLDALSPRFINPTLANQLTSDVQTIRDILGC